MSILSPEIRKLFTDPNFASVATIRKDGSPHCAPVWIDVEGDDLVFGKEDKSAAMRNLRRDPRVAISISNMADPYEVAYVRGRVKEFRPGDVAADWFRAISIPYTGREYPDPGPAESTLAIIEVEWAKYGLYTYHQHTPPDGTLQLPRQGLTSVAERHV